MTRSRLKSRAAVLAVLLGAVVATVVPVSAAIAFDSSPYSWQVELSGTAALQARGAAVTVPVAVQCPYYNSAAVTVTLTQRQGSSTTSATGSTSVTCTGTPSYETVYVVVQSGQRVFKKGPAVAVAAIASCPYSYCSAMDTDSRTVTIQQ
jgi:hypothetical protein